MLKNALLATAALALIAGASVSPVGAADTDAKAKPKLFAVYSSAMHSYSYMPEKYVGSNPNGNCKGQNVSLPLGWTNVPANTKSFAITMFDPVARGSQAPVHGLMDIEGRLAGFEGPK